jgi:hypothetical protein
MKPVPFNLTQNGLIRALTWSVDPRHDSVWAIHAGSDGHVYISSCSEGVASNAHLLRYDPDEGELWDVLDVGAISGDSFESGRVPHSKIHTSLRETSDGWLWGASHMTAPNRDQTLLDVNGSFADPEFGYTGSQLFRVRMNDGIAEHVGTAIPFEGCRSMEINESLNKVYLVSYPRHGLYEYDLTQKKARYIARIGTWGGWEIVQDQQGRLYGSYDNGQFYRYSPTEDCIHDLTIRVPGEPGREDGYNFFINAKRFGQDFFCATGYYDGHIFGFHPGRGAEGEIDDFGLGTLEHPPKHVWAYPYPTALVLYDNRWLFYGCQPIWEATRLMCLDLQTRKRVAVGIMECDGVKSAWLSEAAIGKDSHIMYFADVNMKGIPRILFVDAAEILNSIDWQA